MTSVTFFQTETYQVDLDKLLYIAKNSVLIFQRGISEPLTFKDNKFETSFNESLEESLSDKFAKDVVSALHVELPISTAQIILIVVLGIVGLLIGFEINASGALMQHASTTPITKVTTP